MRILLSAILTVVLVAGVSCGRKAAPRPPEDVAPETITDLTATTSADGIMLSWSRPRTYADGSRMNDLGGFFVQRASGTAGLTFERLGVLAVTDRERFRQMKRFRYVDANVTAGVYRYRVVSFTTDGYVSAPSNVALAEPTQPERKLDAPLP